MLFKERRGRRGGSPDPHCRRVILSDRAYNQIYAETYARAPMETGGLLLGHFDRGIWYVVDATDPGEKADFLSIPGIQDEYTLVRNRFFPG